MLPTDISTLKDRLAELADVFDRKPLTDKAIRVWFDTLREFPCEHVMSLLIGWPKTHTKFPAPAEVWKAMNEWAIDKREQKAARERREEFHPGVGGAQAEAFIAQIRKTLNNPQWTPAEHWQRVHERQPEGSIGKRYAAEVLMKRGLLQEPREPGQDDEEREAA